MGIGRNDPCLCGSGKKFKKCCEGKGVARPPKSMVDSLEKPLEATRQLAEGATRAGFIAAKTQEQIRKTSLGAIGLADQTWQVAQAVGGGSRAECKAGCHWCCTLDVSVSAPEVFRIADYVQEKLSTEEMAALTGRVARHLERRAAPPTGELRREFCPLLVDRKCSVHEARPLKCRGYNSFSASDCEKRFHDGVTRVQWGAIQMHIYDRALKGVVAGLDSVGHAGEVLDLIAALAIALREPEAKARWLRGDPVFADAVAQPARPGDDRP